MKADPQRKQKALDKFLEFRDSVLHGNDWSEDTDLCNDLAAICVEDDPLWEAYRTSVRAVNTPYNEQPELVALLDEAQKALEEA